MADGEEVEVDRKRQGEGKMREAKDGKQLEGDEGSLVIWLSVHLSPNPLGSSILCSHRLTVINLCAVFDMLI